MLTLKQRQGTQYQQRKPCVPPTHISITSLMLAPAFMQISHSFQLDQFPDPTHPMAAKMLVWGNMSKHKTRTSPFTANPDSCRDSIPRETPGDLGMKASLSFQQKYWCAPQEWSLWIRTINAAIGALKRSVPEHSRGQCNGSDQVFSSGLYPKKQSRCHS